MTKETSILELTEEQKARQARYQEIARSLGWVPDDERLSVVTYLYRHFDADGDLLYVGISSNWLSRLIQHSRQSEWYAQIASVTIEKFDSREEAREAEEKEIRSKCPPYNKTW